jgi:ferrous-iron efflux pump FieF
VTAPLDIAQRRRLLHLATTASVVTAALLILAKLVAWLMTGAVSVLASLVDSLMDAMASLVNLFAVRYSLQPADAEHRYGHGKAEALAGLGQAAFIAGSALFLVLESIDRLLHPKPLTALAVGIAVILFAMLATVLLVAIQRHVIRRTGSTAIKADSLHYLTDLITNASILVALILGAMGWPGLDPWFALGIAAYILYSAWHIGREAVQLLMDRELPPEVRQRIVELAYAPPQVRGVHDLRTRQSGHTYFIQLHLELDDHLPLREAHAIADGVEESVRRAFPGAEVLIHQDPVGGVRREHVRSEPRPAG